MKYDNIREGTVLRGWNGKYLVAQVSAGKYLLISQTGNRWTDKPQPLETLPKFIKKEGLTVLHHGGLE